MYSTNERGVRKQPAYGQAQTHPETYGESPASGPAPTTAGHHKHDILNKLDPRVDSTHDRQPMPSQQASNNTNIPEGTYGPHSSRLANALDPRVDSDLDNRARDTGAGAAGGPAAPPPPNMMGAAASGAPAGGGGAAYGAHSSRAANALDPRVDSSTGRTQQHHYAPQQTGAATGVGMGGGMNATNMPAGTGGAPTAAATTGAGAMGGAGGVSAPQTAGPHRSDLMNKLDPRVDSKTGAMKVPPGETRGEV